MNYRHAFHAGNFADVVKHATLALVIEHLKLKPAPFRIIDTHAGAGLYDLGGDAALRTGEWQDGIGRLIGPDAPPLPEPVAGLLRPYLEAIAARNAGASGRPRVYPGSPLLALALMRGGDRLIANELHPDDSGQLEQAIGGDRRAKILKLDGWQVLKATLPPKERRGVVLIDPPFEEPGEFQRLAQGLATAVQRFATGTFILWFPMKDRPAVAMFAASLKNAAYKKVLWGELAVRAPDPEQKLSASGLAILNPPYRLDAQLRILLPFLAERLAQASDARAHVTWLSGEGS